ncbi:MAG: ABC transporter ATP-binding protein [Gammaproteobacteria bacterium]|nr:ABC transporter ATP-binding protein [Gammaproteobacteria bacterium]
MAPSGARARAVSAPYLRVDKVSVSFKGNRVIQDLDLDVSRAELVSLLGPSGCGKTTLLRLVAGLLRAERGQVTLGGRGLDRLPAHRRNVGVVFQNYALFPHLSVADNVAFGLKARRTPAAQVATEVQRVLSLVHMQDYAQRSVRALSGGQQQRVAVARALAVRPDLLLLDEPFSALDRKLRETMQIELRRLLRELEITAVFVTHDQDEALIMSDRIAVMNQGVIEQVDRPDVVYARPATAFVLDFVGTATHLPGTVQSGLPSGGARVQTRLGTVTVPDGFTAGSRVLVAVRPEHISLGPPPGDAERYNQVEVRLRERLFLGSRTVLHFQAGDDERLMVEASGAGGSALEPGSTSLLHWPVDKTLSFAQ